MIPQENKEDTCLSGFAYECHVGNPRASQVSLEACG